jgi:hypothetical protein
MEFTCECCQYSTGFKSNFSKHILTTKHKNLFDKTISIKVVNSKSMTLKKSSESILPLAEISQPLAEISQPLAEISQKVLECKYCEQQFKHSSSLSKHIKYRCMKNKDEDLKELVRLMNLQLEAEREKGRKAQKQVEEEREEKKKAQKQVQSEREEMKKIQKQLETQSKQIEKLMGKLEIHGSFNNNTINNYTLLAYRDTDITHLTQDDYRNCYKKVNHCVKHLIEKVHFNPSKPENMNIYISNMKDKYLMVYDGTNWNLANKVSELERLYEEKEMMLEEWLESNPDPLLKEKFMKYLNNKEKDECLNQIKEEIKLMLYNKGNQLIML